MMNNYVKIERECKEESDHAIMLLCYIVIVYM